MSVMTRFPDFCVYTKGSSHAIKSICNPTTIPSDYDDKLRTLGLQGYRVIAMAMKQLSEDSFFKNITREQAEKDLTFIGFVVMGNKLKPETQSEIRNISKTKIRTPMITGDSVFTAVAVAKDAGIIQSATRILLSDVVDTKEGPIVKWKELPTSASDNSDANTELAITGPSFALLRSFRNDKHKLLYNKLIIRCNVFAEMLPAQKAELITDLKGLDYICGMVGDGSNDSVALSTADVCSCMYYNNFSRLD